MRLINFKFIIGDYHSIDILNSIPKIITLNQIPLSQRYLEIKASINENSEIRLSELPIHWKLSEIKKIL